MTVINRRQLLLSLAACAVIAPRRDAAAHDATSRQTSSALRYFGAKTDATGRHFVVGVDDAGALSFKLELPGRGHATTIRPGQKAHAQQGVIFARRPGRFAVVFNFGNDAVEDAAHHLIPSTPGRHFYGHGVFSPDGRILFTTENDYENGLGVIGVRDATDNYRPIGEFSSHGIGPHDLAFLRDGRTLVVANGGILTHPDAGRRKLNIPTMSPSLAYLDSRTGALAASARLSSDRRRLSIRHLSVSDADVVVVALQYQGPKTEIVPLVALHRAGDALAVMTAPPAILKRMRNYCGSVCFDASQSTLAVTSPRGDITTFWSAADQRYTGHVLVPDGSGVARTRRPDEFIISSGAGGLYRYNAQSGVKTPLSGTLQTGSLQKDDSWDNHLNVAASLI